MSKVTPLTSKQLFGGRQILLDLELVSSLFQLRMDLLAAKLKEIGVQLISWLMEMVEEMSQQNYQLQILHSLLTLNFFSVVSLVI